MAFQTKLLATVFFKVKQYGYEIFQNVKLALQNHKAKNYIAKFITNL